MSLSIQGSMNPRALAATMAQAAVPFVGEAKAYELAAGAVVRIQNGERAYEASFGSIQHRVSAGWLTCADQVGCALAMALAAESTEGPTNEALERTRQAVTMAPVLSAMRLCGYIHTARNLERHPTAANLADARDRLARIASVVSEDAALECAEAVRAIDRALRVRA